MSFYYLNVLLVGNMPNKSISLGNEEYLLIGKLSETGFNFSKWVNRTIREKLTDKEYWIKEKEVILSMVDETKKSIEAKEVDKTKCPNCHSNKIIITKNKRVCLNRYCGFMEEYKNIGNDHERK